MQMKTYYYNIHVCERDTERQRQGLEVPVCYGKYMEVIGQTTAASGDQIGHDHHQWSILVVQQKPLFSFQLDNLIIKFLQGSILLG